MHIFNEKIYFWVFILKYIYTNVKRYDDRETHCNLFIKVKNQKQPNIQKPQIGYQKYTVNCRSATKSYDTDGYEQTLEYSPTINIRKSKKQTRKGYVHCEPNFGCAHTHTHT